MKVRPETARKLNAIHTALSIIEDSGINKVEFWILNLSKEEVFEIATQYNVEIDPATEQRTYNRCLIYIGESKINVCEFDAGFL